jgi:hypothetical protein
MAQVFRPTANHLARLSLVAFVLLPAGLIGAGISITRSPWNSNVNIPLNQPVPFSHEHHVNELGIDCRYCHTSVEKSAFAGIPPTHTCMSCHSQIWTNSPLLEPVRESYRTGVPLVWNRVNKLPDFVYFNHSIHIHQGIGCNVCHGQVNHMRITSKAKPFFMSWCLQCHRHPEQFIRPRNEVFNLDYQPPPDQEKLGEKLVKEYRVNKTQLTDCSVCHR